MNAFCFVLLCAMALGLPAQTLTTLHSFNYSDGEYPSAALIEAKDGNLYGTTSNGGSSSACPLGCGTIFRITPAGTLTTIYNFCAQGLPCTDGANPNAGLMQAADGISTGQRSRAV